MNPAAVAARKEQRIMSNTNTVLVIDRIPWFDFEQAAEIGTVDLQAAVDTEEAVDYAI